MISTRRRFLQYASGGAAGLTIAGCTTGHRSTGGVRSPAAQLPGDAGQGRRAALQSEASVLQILAHPDDDLYFINPETSHFLHAGIPLASVYLTAGESTGLGPTAPAVRRGNSRVVNRSEYSSARQYGLRRAYAQMVTGNMDSPWNRRTMALRSGTVAEIDSLVAAPNVRLVFLGLVEAGDHRPELRGRDLRALLNGTAPSIPTIVADGSPVTNQYAYTRDRLMQALDHLLTEFRPSLVCTLDHDPEHKSGMLGKAVRSTDHPDHTATAQFTVAAVEQYRPAAGAPVPVVHSYRGYANQFWPQNLGGPVLGMKTRLLITYSGTGLPCQVPTGCGDHNLDSLKPSQARFRSTQPRYQGDTSWLRLQSDGRLAAFGVRGGSAVQWTQKQPGGSAWSEPVPVGGSNLVSQISAVTLPDGRIQLFSLQHRHMVGDTPVQQREIVTAVQTTPGGGFGPWQGIGGPDGTTGAQAREIGLPYAVADRGGNVHVVVRTYSRDLALKVQNAQGEWSDWTVLRAPKAVDFQDSVGLLARTDGRVEIFAATRTKLYQWTVAGGVPSTGAQLPLPLPSCAPTPVELPGGRLRLFLRQPVQADILVCDQKSAGTWDTRTTSLRNDGGYGPIAAAPTAAGRDTAAAAHLLALRNDAGTVSTSLWPLPGGAPAWKFQDRLLTGAPSVARDGKGKVVCATIGVDGQLNVVQLDGSGPTA